MTTELNAKEAALQVIKGLPDDASYDDIIYQLYVRQRIERGLQEAREGKTISHEEVKERFAKWRESAGR